MRPLASLLALCALALPALAADVLRVAPPGEGTHTNLQAAVSAAADGDIVLIAPGLAFANEDAVIITGKGLTLIGDGVARSAVPRLNVSSVPTGSSVVLRHLEFVPTPLAIFVGGLVTVHSSDGGVLIEDCVIDAGPPLDGGLPGAPALSILDSTSVSIVRSTILGGDGGDSSATPFVFVPGAGGNAIYVQDSRISVHGSTIVGGSGGDEFFFGNNGGEGRPGIWSIDSQVWLAGVDVTGGDGGFGDVNGVSGAGVDQTGASGFLRELDSAFAGGAGAPGLAILAGGHTAWPGEAVELISSGPIQGGGPASLVMSGPAGELFGLFYSFELGFFPKESFHGALVTGLSTFGGPLFIASMPAGGTLTVPFIAPSIAGLEGFVKIDQLIMQQTGVGLVLSNASAFTQIEVTF